MKSLKANGHQLADPAFQLTVLSREVADSPPLPPFLQQLLWSTNIAMAARPVQAPAAAAPRRS